MDELRLVLRFRNAVPDADGKIVSGAHEHISILEARGYVCWGWWKRDNEPDRTAYLESLPTPFLALIISPSEDLQYEATVDAVGTAPTEDLDAVPTYYRHNIPSIKTWLRLRKLRRIDFDEALAALISRSLATFFSPDDLVGLAAAREATRVVELPSRVILQISDIHLGADHGFLKPNETPLLSADPAVGSKVMTLPDAVRADLDRLGIAEVGAVVVSGDIVTKAEWDLPAVVEFFELLMTRLKLTSDRLFIVPGNHDFYRQDGPVPQVAVNYKHEDAFNLLRAQLFGKKPLDPIEEVVHLGIPDSDYFLTLVLLNSARWAAFDGFYEYGFVGKDRYRPLLGQLAPNDNLRRVRAAVLHHHLVPIQPVEQPGVAPKRPTSVTLDSAELLRDLQAAGVSIVMHGHQHRPDAVKISRWRRDSTSRGFEGEDLYVFASGSSGSTELPRNIRNTYSIFSFEKREVKCTVREIDPEGTDSGTVIEISVPARVSVPT